MSDIATFSVKSKSWNFDVAKKAKEDLEEKIWKSILDTNNRLTSKQQVLRDQANRQEKLWYNKKKKKDNFR